MKQTFTDTNLGENHISLNINRGLKEEKIPGLVSGLHASCSYSKDQNKEYIIKRYFLEDKINTEEFIELNEDLNNHIKELKHLNLPIPKNYAVITNLSKKEITTIDQYVRGETLLQLAKKESPIIYEAVDQAKEIIKQACQAQKNDTMKLNSSDMQISIDPMLANYILNQEQVYYIDFFAPKVRQLDGSFKYRQGLHRIDKETMNYIHFNKIGVWHCFHKKNREKYTGLGEITHDIITHDDYIQNTLSEYNLTIKDLELPYKNIISFLNLKTGET